MHTTSMAKKETKSLRIYTQPAVPSAKQVVSTSDKITIWTTVHEDAFYKFSEITTDS